MSWQEAKTKAEAVYTDIRKNHNYGFVGMVIDALKRLHVREKPKKSKKENTPRSPGGK
jgi:hypothetical protein